MWRQVVSGPKARSVLTWDIHLTQTCTWQTRAARCQPDPQHPPCSPARGQSLVVLLQLPPQQQQQHHQQWHRLPALPWGSPAWTWVPVSRPPTSARPLDVSHSTCVAEISFHCCESTVAGWVGGLNKHCIYTRVRSMSFQTGSPSLLLTLNPQQ